MDSRQFEYQRDMDALRFSDEQKRVLTARVAAGAAEHTSPTRRRSIRPPAPNRAA